MYIAIAYCKGMVVTKPLGNGEKYLGKPSHNCTVYVSYYQSTYTLCCLSWRIHKGLNQSFSCGTTCQGLTDFALGIVGLHPGKS